MAKLEKKQTETDVENIKEGKVTVEEVDKQNKKETKEDGAKDLDLDKSKGKADQTKIKNAIKKKG